MTLLSGVSLAVGFGATTLAATVIFEIPDASFAQRGLVFGGVLYPAVFGTLGAMSQVGVSLSSSRGAKYGAGAFLTAAFAWYSLAEVAPPWGSKGPVSNGFDLRDPSHWPEFFQMFVKIQLYGHENGFPGLFLEGTGVVTHRWIPIAVLACAGFLLVSRRTESPIDELDGALRGCQLAAGYALCVAAVHIGVIAMFVHGPSDVRASLLMGALRSLLVVGVVVPFAGGGLGGAIAAWNQ